MTVTLGSVTIDRIDELDRWPFEPKELFPAITDEQAAAAVAAGDAIDADTGELVLSVATYVVRTPDIVLLVDTGNGNDKPRPALPKHHLFATDYLDRLTEVVAPSDVDVVVSTHLHPDHCGWHTRLIDGRWVPTFPNARYLFVREDFELLRMLHESQQDDPVLTDVGVMFGDSVLPTVDSGQAEVVDLPFVVADGVTLRPRPGHTPGHLIVEVRAGGVTTLFTGDVLHHPLQFADFSLAAGGDLDPARAVASRRELCAEAADENTIVFPAHFGGRDGVRILRDGDGFRYESR
jgi:glyoxylase-like metal-dependent hydrolase (beta-lactamase superfamily II)